MFRRKSGGRGFISKGVGRTFKEGDMLLKNHLYFPIPFFKMFTDMYVF